MAARRIESSFVAPSAIKVAAAGDFTEDEL
jgi:hypothetical protein